MRQKSRLTWALFPKPDAKDRLARLAVPLNLAGPGRSGPSGPRRLLRRGYQWAAAAVARPAALTTKG